MKVLKIIGLSLVGLILLCVIIGFIMPAKSVCERSMEMKASPAVVFDQINTLKNWDKWSPWKEMDPKMVNTYNEIPSGKGAIMSWEGPESGKGKMTITESIVNALVLTDLEFDGMGVSKCSYKVEPGTAGGSKMTWTMETDNGNNPFMRLLSGLMKGMLESQFDKGLSNISTLTEKMPAMNVSGGGIILKVEEGTQEAFEYLAIHDTASVATIGNKMGAAFGEIEAAIKNQKLEMAGAPFALYYTDSQTNFDFDMGIPVSKSGKAVGRIKPGKMKPGKTVVAIYQGPYENTWKGSEAVMNYLKEHPKLSIAGPMYESYVSDPGMEPDSTKWITNVVFPVN
ncbi:MAG TPA: GyrI-like domain-containing protein [Flavobacteriales bacterium]|nr:GyrI-like domain-containing protein [Flavobacteriales bacterium]HPH82615.1 GyrI-like domain-containing protein [Flavobacteriales bacterium]